MNFRKLLRRITGSRPDNEIDAEVRGYAEMLTDEKMRSGVAPEEAHRSAMLELGGLEQVKEEIRTVQPLVWVRSFLQDIRFGLRMLRRAPGVTSVAVLTLALGIGASAAIFSIVYGTLLAPMPYPQSDELVMIWSQLNGARNLIAPADYLDWKRDSTTFQGMYAWSWASFDLSAGPVAEQVNAAVLSPGRLGMLGEPMLLGRDFLPEEGQPGRDHVVILTHKLWVRRFGADPQIVGQTIRLDRQPYTVVGVLMAGLNDRGDAELEVPLSFRPDQINRTDRWLLVQARLRPGVTIAQAQSNMDVLAQQIAESDPDLRKNWQIRVEPLHDDFVPQTTRTELWLFLGAVGFVLLIACANVANLVLSRAASREREIVVRAAIGAKQSRLFRQLLTESFVLAILGGMAGVFTADLILKGILTLIPVNTLPYEADTRLNVPVLLFMLATTMIAGVVFGSAPAWQASRLNLSEALKEGGRSGNATGSHKLRRALVITEFALALCLLTGAGLALRSFEKLTNADLGMRTDKILTFWLQPTVDHFTGTDESTKSEQTASYYRQVLANIDAAPGVTGASISASLPGAEGAAMPFNIVGQPAPDAGARPTVAFNTFTPDFFRTFGVRLIHGRTFNDQDVAGKTPVALVNEAFVRQYLPNVDPLGQRLQLSLADSTLVPPAAEVEWEIVGVFHDIRNRGPRETNVPEVDIPFWQSPQRGVSVAVRTAGDPAGASKDVTAAIRSFDPDLPLAYVRTMDQFMALTLAGERWIVALYSGFGFAALVLAVLGVYGVMSYMVVQRTSEIGIRMALGADRMAVLRLVLAEGLNLAAIGVAIGFACSAILAKLMSSSLYGVGAHDPVTFFAVAAVLVAVAVLACLIPGLRATRVDPINALR
jgi:putative ABC transport system permease protein